jgi:hypothetical protein
LERERPRPNQPRTVGQLRLVAETPRRAQRPNGSASHPLPASQRELGPVAYASLSSAGNWPPTSVRPLLAIRPRIAALSSGP